MSHDGLHATGWARQRVAFAICLTSFDGDGAGPRVDEGDVPGVFLINTLVHYHDNNGRFRSIDSPPSPALRAARRASASPRDGVRAPPSADLDRGDGRRTRFADGIMRAIRRCARRVPRVALPLVDRVSRPRSPSPYACGPPSGSFRRSSPARKRSVRRDGVPRGSRGIEKCTWPGDVLTFMEARRVVGRITARSHFNLPPRTTIAMSSLAGVHQRQSLERRRKTQRTVREGPRGEARARAHAPGDPTGGGTYAEYGEGYWRRRRRLELEEGSGKEPPPTQMRSLRRSAS